MTAASIPLGPIAARMVARERVARRGYHAVYRQHELNRCPGCGRSHWLVGRVSAECAFCGTAVPFDLPPFTPEKD